MSHLGYLKHHAKLARQRDARVFSARFEGRCPLGDRIELKVPGNHVERFDPAKGLVPA